MREETLIKQESQKISIIELQNSDCGVSFKLLFRNVAKEITNQIQNQNIDLTFQKQQKYGKMIQALNNICIKLKNVQKCPIQKFLGKKIGLAMT